MSRRATIAAGIVALHDTLRALRGAGAARLSGSESERGAMFDLAGLADRLTAYADDQGSDDWDDFWITATEVATLQSRTASLAVSLRGLSPASVAALTRLAEELVPLVAVDD